jgi:UDPglucose 6-dehydrogenase
MWGLSFKPDTDDIREASSLTLIELLTGAGAKVRAYDPIATENIRKEVSPRLVETGKLVFCDDQYETLDGCDALLLVTEWKQFRNPDFALLRKRLRAAAVFDGRNQYDPSDLAAAGFEYYGIGRGAAPAAARR